MPENNDFPALDNLDLNIKKDLIKYNTLRIDFKNFGMENDIELLESSNISYKKYPDWFCDEQGRGLILHSFKGSIDLKIKCINEGSLRIAARGIHFLDKDNNKFPIYINIDEFYLNGDLMIENKVVWHDEPYIIFKDVEDSEIVNVKIHWSPVNKNSLFKNSLKIKNESLSNEIKKLKRDLANANRRKNQVQNDLNKYKEENFNLLVTLEKVAKENYNYKKELDDLKNSNKKHSLFKKK